MNANKLVCLSVYHSLLKLFFQNKWPVAWREICPSPHSKRQPCLLCVLKNIFGILQVTFSNDQSLLELEFF